MGVRGLFSTRLQKTAFGNKLCTAGEHNYRKSKGREENQHHYTQDNSTRKKRAAMGGIQTHDTQQFSNSP